MPVGDISREKIQKWVTQNNLAPDTQHNRLKTARSFLEFARLAKYIPLNPVKGEDNKIKLPKPQRGEILSYGPREIRRLFWPRNVFSVNSNGVERAVRRLGIEIRGSC